MSAAALLPGEAKARHHRRLPWQVRRQRTGLYVVCKLKLILYLLQRHSFRAKPTRDIAGSSAGSFGAAGPSIFGPGAVAAPADDEHSLTWTSGMARNRWFLFPICHIVSGTSIKTKRVAPTSFKRLMADIGSTPTWVRKHGALADAGRTPVWQSSCARKNRGRVLVVVVLAICSQHNPVAAA